MFPPEALAELEITPQQVGLRCNPIVDILPGGQAISCYPLASIAREAIEHHRDGSALADHFTRQIAPFRPMKLYKHCDSCQWLRRGECTGGCVAGSMKRLRSINTEPVCA
jgi:radical SAM protein with 4Fe4S-binding SPASM domain